MPPAALHARVWAAGAKGAGELAVLAGGVFKGQCHSSFRCLPAASSQPAGGPPHPGGSAAMQHTIEFTHPIQLGHPQSTPPAPVNHEVGTHPAGPAPGAALGGRQPEGLPPFHRRQLRGAQERPLQALHVSSEAPAIAMPKQHALRSPAPASVWRRDGASQIWDCSMSPCALHSPPSLVVPQPDRTPPDARSTTILNALQAGIVGLPNVGKVGSTRSAALDSRPHAAPPPPQGNRLRACSRRRRSPCA